jgi:hypothetical protein
MSKASPFPAFLHALRTAAATFPDIRKGKNKHYTVRDAALGAFAVFFTQSPSFLAYQRDMAAHKAAIPGQHAGETSSVLAGTSGEHGQTRSHAEVAQEQEDRGD